MLNRSSAPVFSTNFSFNLPKAEVISLNGGSNLIFLPGVQQEIVKLELIFKAGKWHESSSGLSHFTASLIDKGTATKTAQEIAEIFDYYGAQLEISPGYDYTVISLFTLAKYIQELFPLFLEILVSPSFPEEELILQKEIFIQNLKVSNQKNSYVAAKLLRKNIFGENHPYGRTIEEGNVTQLRLEDIKSFFKQNFHPFEIYLIGNIKSNQIDWVAQQFNSLIPQKLAESNFSKNAGFHTQHVPKDGSVQSSIRFGRQIINRHHSDYFQLLLLNHILGGYFGSRLMKSIREEKGLTYGIYSSIHPFKNDCMISIGADVNNDKLEVAKEEIKKEIKKLGEYPISEDEFISAKNHFLGSLQLEIANPFAVLEKIKNLRLNKLEEPYYNNLFSALKSANPKDFLGVAQKYFDADSFQEVTVGQIL